MNAGTPSAPSVGVALMMEPQFAHAAYPLFAAGEVEIVEWSFDTLWSGAIAPEWLDELLKEFSQASRLLGHGVTYSMFSAGGEERAELWCEHLRRECCLRDYHHITEHFGFMVAGDFHRGAPLPVPFTPEILSLGRDRLVKLADAAQRPIGLENHAFAFCAEDVRVQGDFLEQLLAPIDGFLLLDLHNIHCQACNFDISPEALIDAYPTSRVRELHLSGGSWSEAASATVRRDTHDGPVPEELYPLLDYALRVCPGIEAVIFEHLGNALPNKDSHARYLQDYRRIANHVHEFRAVSAA
jgi:uncharacterized protein